MTTEEERLLGDHPQTEPWQLVNSSDGRTNAGVTHRSLSAVVGSEAGLVRPIRDMLVTHHVSTETLIRDRARDAALARLGHAGTAAMVQRYPQNSSTRKGNLAEIVLAEYVVDSCMTELPVYRLRYNPNIDQSMKGDDVLAFDLDATPVRIVVGEAKFRGRSTKAAADEIIDGLLRANSAGLPSSLSFVADRLYESGQIELADRIMNCTVLFAQDRLRIDYVGLLMSDHQAAARVNRHDAAELRRLAFISFALQNPEQLIDACFEGLRDAQ